MFKCLVDFVICYSAGPKVYANNANLKITKIVRFVRHFCQKRYLLCA